jgi:hypothetical protein
MTCSGLCSIRAFSGYMVEWKSSLFQRNQVRIDESLQIVMRGIRNEPRSSLLVVLFHWGVASWGKFDNHSHASGEWLERVQMLWSGWGSVPTKARYRSRFPSAQAELLDVMKGSC